MLKSCSFISKKPNLKGYPHDFLFFMNSKLFIKVVIGASLQVIYSIFRRNGTEQIIDDPYDFLEKDDLLERLISLEHETTLKQVVMEKNY